MKICRVEKITDQKHLNLYTVGYQDKKKRHNTWVFASRKNPDSAGDTGKPDAVVIVPFHKKLEKLVVIKEFRVVLGGIQYGFPAGLVDQGETVTQAGRRELFEETGLELTRVLNLSPPVFSSSGMTDETVGLLYAECDGTPTSRFNEASEDIEVLLLSKNEARTLLDDPGIIYDVKTWIVLNAYAATGTIPGQGR